jgi:small subunit ribosomal protein S19
LDTLDLAEQEGRKNKMVEKQIQPMEMKRKEFTYRGNSIEDLKALDVREFAGLLKSNEKRTVLRQSDEIQKFIVRAQGKIEKGKLVKTHSRYLVIVPRMIGMRIGIYNGKEYANVDIIPEMIGHRFGEFAITRNKVKHGSAGVGATRSSASKSVK